MVDGEREAGADAASHSGLEDEFDDHWKELLGAAALSTLLPGGIEVNSWVGTGSTNSDLVAALAVEQEIRTCVQVSLSIEAG
ncbi:hypothetical protein QA636_35030 [Bradyrhizobium brasilense]|uniref:Uncharacterized protein n=1 Tax=Bradyrhizobium brasilense TaxID=1419277 RepID=A0ABY8JDD2_9BRAD|nr:hypothetical protein [Bradyrhizobium brasilense]WFU62621.1 hypothetical protein QA636_35030 [Bradyrhizobium brasilense]